MVTVSCLLLCWQATSTDGVLEEARDTLTDILGEDGYVGQYETYR